MRAKIVNTFIVFMFIALGLGMANLEIIHGGKLKYLSEKNRIRLITQDGSRGRILDREGNVIVDSYLSYNAMVLPQDDKELNKTFSQVAKVLGVDADNLKAEYKKGFFAPFFPVIIAKNIDIKKAVALEELKSDYPGIVIQPQPLRYYPYGRLACHVIGYLSEIDHWRLTKLEDYGYKTKDIVGYTGIEEKYDYYLRQEEGALSVEVDHRSRFMRAVGFKPPKNGKDIQLTLNLKIQKICEDNLEGRKGSIIVMDPSSGEILSMTSRPNFSPSIFIKQSDSASRIFNGTDAALMNRAISGLYPPASVFKLVVASAALETGKISLGTTFNCPGGTNIGRRRFACWDTHNQQNLIGAIAHSCDVFFYHTGIIIGAQAIHDYAVKFGFGKTTGINLPYETSGFVPDPIWRKIHKLANWFDGDTANFAIGQGELMVTPIQTIKMTAVFANRGTLVTPYIVKSIDGQDVSVYLKRSSRIPLRDTTIDYIRRGLKGVTAEGGTASILGALPVSVAGKTGSAQVSRGAAHGWFLGYFPMNNPKYVICVFLEHGGSGYAAAVVAKQIIDSMVKEGLM